MYSSNYLAHYGILGMKWGVRRFQPYSTRGRKSGEGGKEVGEAKRISKDKLFSQSIKGGKDKPNVSPAEKIANESSKIASNTGKIVNTAIKAKKVKSGRESKRLSDAELKKRIARLELEKRYEDLSNEDIARGKVTTQEILDSVGSGFAIAASAATVASVIYQLTKK